ncbi:PrgI family protein [Patescibacteria group bacterium]|nr:PrgI family protein [Patescibacteria group bacterium]
MKYQVPQFIEIEDKIIGPFTIKQFTYLVGGAGMCFIIYTFLPFYVALLFIALVIPLSLALAFHKINNKPFIDFLEAAFFFYTKQNLYIWKKEERKVEKSTVVDKADSQVYVPRLSDSKLKELSWSLDINENLNPLTGEGGKNTK